MNLLLLEAHEIAPDGRVELEDRRAEHIRKVLRAEPGQALRVGVVDGGIGEGRVEAMAGNTVTLTVSVDDQQSAPAPWIDLVVGLPRPAVLHRVLQTTAAMGVGHLHLTTSWRVEKSFFSSPALRPEAIRKHLLLGAEQGMTTRLPKVSQHKLLVPFVRQLEENPQPPVRLVAHPEATRAFEEVFPRDGSSKLEIAIGPEGGWIDREIETLGAAGFVPFSLGPWILKVETAVTASLAQAELLRRQAVSTAC